MDKWTGIFLLTDHKIMNATEYHPLSTDDSVEEAESYDQSTSTTTVFNEIRYETATNDQQHAEYDSTSDNTTLNEGVRIRNNKPFPISRPPTKHRDGIYGVAFLSHFAVVLLLSLIEQDSLQKSLLNYERAGSISSIVMIVTLLGSFIGAILAVFIIGGYPSFRETCLNFGLIFSTVAKICLGNLLLFTRSTYSLFGIAILLSALVDSMWYKSARESLSFSSALIQMTIDVTRQYGISLFFACAAIISSQTCVLLWWGAFFTGLLSSTTPLYAQFSTAAMILSLYWIYQFFHMFIAYVVGGCVLWVFVKGDNEPLDPIGRVLLYLQCAVTTSLGSLCKAALFAPVAQIVLAGNYWAAVHRSSAVGGCCCRLSSCCLEGCHPLAIARRHHRIALSLCATYGRTFSKSAEDHVQEYPDTIVVCMVCEFYHIDK